MLRDCLFAAKHGVLWPTARKPKRAKAGLHSTHAERMVSLAELGENLYEIQTEIEEKRLEQARLHSQEKRDNVLARPPEEQKAYFFRSEALRRQVQILMKSESSVRIMMQQIHDSANIERVKKMLNKTIAQQEYTENLTSEAEGRELLESIDTMTQYIDTSNDAIQNLGLLAQDKSPELDREYSNLLTNPDFLDWRGRLEGTLGDTVKSEHHAQEVAEVQAPQAAHSMLAA